jgi:hypothetical protein
LKRRNAARLTELFRCLGARSPESWADSEVTEGIPQLASFLFLKQAWSRVVSEQDPSWIDGAIREATAHPTRPYAGLGQALRSLRSRGATDAELTDLARGVQAQLLFHLCYLLGDPNLGELKSLFPEGEDLGDIAWGFFLLDDEGRPVEPLACLHESVLDTDPTGREMTPRGTAG